MLELWKENLEFFYFLSLVRKWSKKGFLRFIHEADKGPPL